MHRGPVPELPRPIEATREARSERSGPAAPPSERLGVVDTIANQGDLVSSLRGDRRPGPLRFADRVEPVWVMTLLERRHATPTFRLSGTDRVTVLSAGTDGTDGPTDAAGAIADGRTVARADAKGLSAQTYLAQNDSYHFFDAIGDLIRTGPTRTNVNDVRLLLIR